MMLEVVAAGIFLLFRRMRTHKPTARFTLHPHEYQHIRARRLDVVTQAKSQSEITEQKEQNEYKFYVGDGRSRRWPARLLGANVTASNEFNDTKSHRAKKRVKTQLRQIEIDAQSVQNRHEARRLLCMCLPERQRLESDFLPSAVELGLTHLQPITCAHAQRASLASQRKRRIQNVFHAAAIQSERFFLPRVFDSKNLQQLQRFLARAKIPPTNILVLHPRKMDAPSAVSISLDEYLQRNRSANNQMLAFIVGPEGGFSAAELAFLHKNSYTLVNLGGNILRISTASLAALAKTLIDHSK